MTCEFHWSWSFTRDNSRSERVKSRSLQGAAFCTLLPLEMSVLRGMNAFSYWRDSMKVPLSWLNELVKDADLEGFDRLTLRT